LKILYVVGAYGQRYLANEIHRELVQEFSRRGHHCIVYAGVTPDELGGEPVSYRDGAVEVRRQLCDTRGQHRLAAELGRRVLRYPRFLPLLQGLRALLAKHPDIDVIHADAVYPIGAIVALAALGHRAALVPSIHGGDLINYPGYGYGRFLLTRRLIRWTFHRSALVRVNSSLMAKRAQALGCQPAKLHPILVNIGDRFFAGATPLAARRAAARALVCERHGFAPTAPLLVSTGRLLLLKGFHDLVAAVKLVVQTVPELRLVIAGPNFVDPVAGDQRAALEKAITAHGLQQHIHLRDSLHYEREMARYLAAADLMVAVAHIEGLNRVVAEAGSQGTPSIVSTMTGVAPLVEELDAGVVVPPRDPAALAAALTRLLASGSTLARHAANAHRLAQRFRSVVIADELLALYTAAHRRYV
jgi:glycosyltransferase involved in cell wall biosynthesis